MDRRSPDSELETGHLPYDEDRTKVPGAGTTPGAPRSPYDLSCSGADNPCLVTNNNNNNNDESVENHNVNNNGNSHCHSGECGRAAESNRTRQRNLEIGLESAQESGYYRTQVRGDELNGSTLSQNTGHERLPKERVGYESIPCQGSGYERLISQDFEYDVMGNRESGRRRSSRLLEELTRRHCDSGVDLGVDLSASLDYSTNTATAEIEWDSRTSPFLDDDSSKQFSTHAEIDRDSRHSSMAMNYDKVSPTVLDFDITSCDTSKCCPFYLDHHRDQCPNATSEDSKFCRQSVSASPTDKTPEYSENDLELCSEHHPAEHQSNDSRFRLQGSYDRGESGSCGTAKDRHSDYESCEDNCDQMCCSDSGSSSYSECGPDCNCSASPEHVSSLPQVRWTARLLGGNEQEVEAFKKKKMASMKK